MFGKEDNKDRGGDVSPDECLFWEKRPHLLPLYGAFRDRLLNAHPETKIRVSKTQISFYNRRMYAMVSPPVRRKKGWPKEFLLVSFGLPERVESPRIAVSVEAYPNRWTHHVLVESDDEIDDTLMGWIGEAYAFSESKR